MSASVESGFGCAGQRAGQVDRLLADGSQAWLGLVLMLASAIVSIRFLCWAAAVFIRLLH